MVHIGSFRAGVENTPQSLAKNQAGTAGGIADLLDGNIGLPVVLIEALWDYIHLGAALSAFSCNFSF